MNISCLIVEDEPLAAEVLQDYIRQTPFLELKGVCTDALFALEFLQKERVDLIFMDIHLPRLKGLDFLRTLTSPPKVILTTAYHDYALEGYELNVVDYLVKPIEFGRFIAAVNKLQAGTLSIPQPLVSPKQTIAIQTEKRKVIIRLEEIIYIESQKEYVQIHTKERSYTTKVGITKIEEELGSGQFLRIHRSFMVAVDRIRAYDATGVEIEGKQIPIGRNYKEQVLSLLSSRL